MSQQQLISIVVPCFNEAAGITAFLDSVTEVLKKESSYSFEILVVDNGSTDSTADKVREYTQAHVRLIALSRNFGKEAATSAGIHEAKGAAVITIDADGQHPVSLIPDFIKSWQAGNKVVVGVRKNTEKQRLSKRFGSRWFYKTFNRIAGIKVVPGSTDFRLIDREVANQFNKLTEHNRITRVLVDWLGYDKAYIPFVAPARLYGTASYSNKKLANLAIDSLVSHSSSPLYFAAYLGLVMVPFAILLGLTMIIDTLLGDPLGWQVTGSAYIVVLMLGLIGILLISQGIIGLYLSQIQTETKNRPLYVIDSTRSSHSS